MRSKDITKELDAAKSIQVVADMEGGQLIQKTLRKDLISAVDSIANKFKTAKPNQIIAMCATIKATLDMLRVYSNAKTNKKMLEEELEKALKEEQEEATS